MKLIRYEMKTVSCKRGPRKCNCSWLRAILCTFITMGLKIFSICFKTDVALLWREVKCPLRIVLCKESPYHLIDVLAPSSVILRRRDFYQVEFTDTCSTNKIATKIVENISVFRLLTRILIIQIYKVKLVL